MNAPASDDDRPDDRLNDRLDDHSRRLTQALQILDLEVDYALLLGLAADTSRAVGPDAGPISTFLVGYAAGMTRTSDTQAATDAVERAVDVARAAIRKTGDGSTDDGWANTAQ